MPSISKQFQAFIIINWYDIAKGGIEHTSKGLKIINSLLEKIIICKSRNR